MVEWFAKNHGVALDTVSDKYLSIAGRKRTASDDHGSHYWDTWNHICTHSIVCEAHYHLEYEQKASVPRSYSGSIYKQWMTCRPSIQTLETTKQPLPHQGHGACLFTLLPFQATIDLADGYTKLNSWSWKGKNVVMRREYLYPGFCIHRLLYCKCTKSPKRPQGTAEPDRWQERHRSINSAAIAQISIYISSFKVAKPNIKTSQGRRVH